MVNIVIGTTALLTLIVLSLGSRMGIRHESED